MLLLVILDTAIRTGHTNIRTGHTNIRTGHTNIRTGSIDAVKFQQDNSTSSNAIWLVAQVQPRKEDYAVAHLQRQRFRTIFPRLRATRARARKFESVLVPLFPGYLFVGVNALSEDWRAINGTRGVLRLLCGNRGTPQRLPGGVVDALMAATDELGVVTRPLFELCVGDAARVLDGPFAQHVGKIAALDGKGRVDVMLEILGSCVPVRLASTQLQPEGLSLR